MKNCFYFLFIENLLFMYFRMNLPLFGYFDIFFGCWKHVELRSAKDRFVSECVQHVNTYRDVQMRNLFDYTDNAGENKHIWALTTTSRIKGFLLDFPLTLSISLHFCVRVQAFLHHRSSVLIEKCISVF